MENDFTKIRNEIREKRLTRKANKKHNRELKYSIKSLKLRIKKIKAQEKV